MALLEIESFQTGCLLVSIPSPSLHVLSLFHLADFFVLDRLMEDMVKKWHELETTFFVHGSRFVPLQVAAHDNAYRQNHMDGYTEKLVPCQHVCLVKGSQLKGSTHACIYRHTYIGSLVRSLALTHHLPYSR